MEYRFPGWLSHVLLGLIALVAGGAAYLTGIPFPWPGIFARAVASILGVCLLALLLWGYLHVLRYRIRIGADSVEITGAFRARKIPFAAIKQVVTCSAPRSGTDSWLIDGNGVAVAKVDGGLVGFDVLQNELNEALRPYQAIFCRRQIFGSWEMQVAGDTHWVPCAVPRFTSMPVRWAKWALGTFSLLVAIGLLLGFHEQGLF